ncbi:hypothetical protein KCU92_g17, partial [Aureobasidium melanogenum]
MAMENAEPFFAVMAFSFEMIPLEAELRVLGAQAYLLLPWTIGGYELRRNFFFWNLPDVASPYVILLPPQRSLLGQWYMEFGLEQNLDRLYHHGAQLNCSVVPVRVHGPDGAAFFTTGLGRLGTGSSSASNGSSSSSVAVHVAGSVRSRYFGCLDAEEPPSLPGAKRTGTTYGSLRIITLIFIRFIKDWRDCKDGVAAKRRTVARIESLEHPCNGVLVLRSLDRVSPGNSMCKTERCFFLDLGTVEASLRSSLNLLSFPRLPELSLFGREHVMLLSGISMRCRTTCYEADASRHRHDPFCLTSSVLFSLVDACSIEGTIGASMAVLGLRLYIEEDSSSRTFSQVEGPTEPAKPELDMLLQRPGPIDESTMLLRLACVWRFCLSGSLALEASEACDRVRNTLCLSALLDLPLTSCG